METTVVITVNKIIENKTATITIDLKSITGGYKEPTDTNTVGEVKKTAKVVIKVDGKSVSEDPSVDKNKTIKQQVTGTGSVLIEIEITDEKGTTKRTHTLDLTKETAYTFQ